MTAYLITPEGSWELHTTQEVDDLVCVLQETGATKLDKPLPAVSRQQVVTRLGRGIPADFPQASVETGDPDKGAVRGWWDFTVQAYLAGTAVTPTTTEQQTDSPPTEDPAPSADGAEGPEADHWPRHTRRWADVEFSGADQRVLLATSKGILTPAGTVVSRPLGQSGDLAKLATKYQWATRTGEPDPQIWITGEALEALSFPTDEATPDNLAELVEDFFGATVKHHKSGYFTCLFAIPEDPRGPLAIDVVLLPATALDPSPSRPADRGMVGVADTPTELPDDEESAVHLLGDRIQWLFSLEGALPAYRWSRVGVQVADATMKRARPKPKNSLTPPKRAPYPLPSQISENGKLPQGWWTPTSWRRQKHRGRGEGIDVELDQQAAYLPSAETLYIGYGQPEFVDPDPAVFTEQHPPFGVFRVTTPPGDALDLHHKLPIPHPGMLWADDSTFWATTVDIQQLTAPVEQGGAGLGIAELKFHAAYVWPEQHQWLKAWAALLRGHLSEARAAGRADYEQMLKAIYTSYLGRAEAIGKGAWKYPHFHHQHPALYTSVEGLTRWRAMRFAVRTATSDLYPTGVLADAWFYRIPAGTNPAALEDPVREDGTRANGTYRLKSQTPTP